MNKVVELQYSGHFPLSKIQTKEKRRVSQIWFRYCISASSMAKQIASFGKVRQNLLVCGQGKSFRQPFCELTCKFVGKDEPSDYWEPAFGLLLPDLETPWLHQPTVNQPQSRIVELTASSSVSFLTSSYSPSHRSQLPRLMGFTNSFYCGLLFLIFLTEAHLNISCLLSMHTWLWTQTRSKRQNCFDRYAI